MAAPLFDPARHETLAGGEWDEGAVRAAIRRIGDDANDAFTDSGLWPIHPMDLSPERPPDCLKPIYHGAAGVIWALGRLRDLGFASPELDYLPTVATLVERYRADLRGNPAMASYVDGERGRDSVLIGEAGLKLLHWTLAPSPALEDELHADLTAKIGDPRGLLWGGAGSMLAALAMLRRTGEARWREIYLRHAEGLWESWTHDPDLDCHLWTQDLYGVVEKRLSALHGFAANAIALLAGKDHLSEARRTELFARVRRAALNTGVRENGHANWRLSADRADPGEEVWRVQYCIGAPGMVMALAALPADPETDALLLEAGELIWAAGPPTKPPCLCHGTSGNGYALLKLHAWTDDPLWLFRARRLAMHAVAQADHFALKTGQRKYSLWTGDLGLAVFLADCIRGEAQFPTLDLL